MDAGDLEFAVLHGLVGLGFFGLESGVRSSGLLLEPIRV